MHKILIFITNHEHININNSITNNAHTQSDMFYNYSKAQYKLSIVRVEKYGQIEPLFLLLLEGTLRDRAIHSFYPYFS